MSRGPIDTRSIARFSSGLRTLPTRLAQLTAEKAAPIITEAAETTFHASQDPFGVPWVPGVDGQTVTLRKTGALEEKVFYVAIGTRLRVAIGVPYAKYQIGKRNVFPSQGALLPATYSDALAKAAAEAGREYMAEYR